MRKFMFAAASIAIAIAGPAVAQGKGQEKDHKGQQHGKAQAKPANRAATRKAAPKPAQRRQTAKQQDRRPAQRQPGKQQAQRQQAKQQDRRQADRQQNKKAAARKQAAQRSNRRDAARKQATRQKAQRKQAARQIDRRQAQRQQAQRQQAQRQKSHVQQRRQAARQVDRRQDQRQAAIQQNRRQAALQRNRQQQRIAQRTQQARQNIRQNVRDARRVVTARDRDIRSFRYADYDRGRRVVHQRYVVNNDGRIRYRNWQNADYGVINGCPPGLARKGNGCLPPGQARKLYERQQARYYRNVAQVQRRAERRDYYDYLSYNPRYSQANYLYSNGYAYRVNNSRNLVTSYVPLVGGALYQGNTWPQQYSYEPVPTYYSSYYGNNQDYSYRYADDTLFGVNPQNQSITSIAGLLTGNDFAVGQQIPSGYDVYNVPYQYRSQYTDRADANYRYSDGYVYQVDPKTRLIQAAIQLLA